MDNKKKLDHKHHYYAHKCTYCGKLQSKSHLAANTSEKKRERNPKKYLDDMVKNLEKIEEYQTGRREWDK